MAETTSIVLTFIDASGKNRVIRVDDPKVDLTELQVTTAMAAIIAKNIFEDPAFVSAASAVIVTTTSAPLYTQVP